MPDYLRVCLVVLSLSYPLVSAAAQSQDLPTLGDPTSGVISLEQERKLGQDFLRSLRAQAPTISDPLLKDYLEYLIYLLAEHSQLQDKRLELIILDSRQLNAFAVPGGVVGINLGLFLYAETRSEFSAILTHELAHISQRHFARRIENARRNTIPNLTGLLASIIIMATTGGDAGMAAMTATQAAAQQKSLRFSRSREAEADRIGIQTLADSGMDPRAMAYMFERLNKTNRYAGQHLPEFLLTHPVTQSRIADSYNQTRQYKNSVFPSDLDYQMMRVRVLVMDETSPDISVKRMQDGLHAEDPNIHMAYQYGLVLALNRMTRTDEAQAQLRPLIKDHPDKIAFILAQAEIEMTAQRYDNAVHLLHDKLRISPDNFPMSMQYADALLKENKTAEAQTVLERQVVIRPNDSDIWYLLAETYGLANNIIGVHQARAEYFMLTGNLDQAEKQLEYALPLVEDNFQTMARIKQRLQDIHALQQEK